MKAVPVVAAIPNYNMGEQLAELLPQLRAPGQEYADIFVLDDASTDNSHDIVRGLDLGVTFVEHFDKKNHGAGPTRNLIIDYLGYDAIIHFLDADTDLLTERMPEVANEAMAKAQHDSDDQVGFVGGLALTAQGTQNFWNYGPRQCLYNDLGAIKQEKIAHLAEKDPEKAKEKREELDERLRDWPNPFVPPQWRKVFWNIEQNLLIQSDVFDAVWGFDPKLREHEIQQLAINMHDMGLQRYFDPSFAVQHKEIDVRHYHRVRAQLRAEVAIHRRDGLWQWVRPRGSFKPDI